MKQGAANPLTPVGKAIYLVSMTLGCACMVITISWVIELGCAIVLGTQLLSGRYGDGSRYMTWVGRCIVLLALAAGGWMFTVAYHSGHVWERYSPQWWWVGFISLMWLLLVITELKKKTKS